MPPTAPAHSTAAPAVPPRSHVLVAAFCGGATGTLLRAGLAQALPHDPGAWPVATLVVNLVGAFLIGVLSVWLPRSPDLDPRLHPFLATGLCGGLTTFATLQIELVDLLSEGAYGVALAYVVVTVAAGLCAVVAGRAVGSAERTRETG